MTFFPFQTNQTIFITIINDSLPEGPERQFAQAFDNLMSLLQSAGAGPESVGLLTVWIPDRAHRAYINKDWLRFYPGADRPARKTNQAPLPAGVEVQLMAVCVTGEQRVPLEIPGLSHKDPLPMGARLRLKSAFDISRFAPPLHFRMR